MEALKVSLGRVKIQDLTRERLIEFGKKRANTAQVYRRYQSIFPSSARKSGSGEILSRRSSTKRRSRILRACWSKQEFWNSNLKKPRIERVTRMPALVRRCGGARFRSLPVAFARSLRKDIDGLEGAGRGQRETKRCADCGRRQRSDLGQGYRHRRRVAEQEVAEIVPRKIPSHTDFPEQDWAPSIEAIVKRWP